MLAAESALIWPRAHRAEDFGRDDEVGGIEKIDAGFQCEREVLARLFRAERPVAAHRPRRLLSAAIAHTSEANSRDGDASIAKLGVLHVRVPYQVKVN